MSKTETIKTYDTEAKAKARVTVLNKTGVAHTYVPVDGGFQVVTETEKLARDAAAQAAVVETKAEAPAAPTTAKKRHDGGYVKQAVAFLRRSGVQSADQIELVSKVNRKGETKVWMKFGDKLLNFFPNTDRAQSVLSGL